MPLEVVLRSKCNNKNTKKCASSLYLGSYFASILLICRDTYIRKHVRMAAFVCFLLNFNLCNWKYNIRFEWILFYISPL